MRRSDRVHPESLDRPRGDAGEPSLIEALPDGGADIPRAFERVVLDELLDTLDERERTIVRLYYREDLTQREIGQRLGYSQMHISRLLRRAGEQLQLVA